MTNNNTILWNTVDPFRHDFVFINTFVGISGVMPPCAKFSHISGTNNSRNSFIPRTSRIQNSLSLSSVLPMAADVGDLKNKVHMHFRNNPFQIIPGQSYPQLSGFLCFSYKLNRFSLC